MKDMKELLHSAHLTKTQRIIAEYVLDNASEACFMTSTEIALKLGVSESSVIRFSRTIGFDGFMDFQKALRKDYQNMQRNYVFLEEDVLSFDYVVEQWKKLREILLALA